MGEMETRSQITDNVITELIATNVAWLKQALSLVQELDDVTFKSSPQGLVPHRVGSHLRHVLEFYECFLDGLRSLTVDYDARQRSHSVETSRDAAADKISTILQRLEDNPWIHSDSVMFVRMENAEEGRFENPYLRSSVSRELQALSSHTIHHFALIAITLRVHGLDVDADFGMSPSTLRYQTGKLELTSA
jgi:hypothetical protein